MVPGILRGAVESSLRRQRHRVRICEEQDQLVVIYHRAEMTMYKKGEKKGKIRNFQRIALKKVIKSKVLKVFCTFADCLRCACEANVRESYSQIQRQHGRFKI